MAIATQVQTLIDGVPPYAIGLVVFSVAFAVYQLFTRTQSIDAPLIGRELGSKKNRIIAYYSKAQEMYLEGYRKYPNTPWRITTIDGDHVVLPPKYLDELRSLPDDTVDNISALESTLEANKLQMRFPAHLLIHVVRADLTPGLVRVNPKIMTEVEKCMDTEFPPCKDWTPVNVHQTFLRVVAIVSGHVFIGPDLCRREEYIDAAINYTIIVFTAVAGLKYWPKPIRWMGTWFNPTIKALWRYRDKALDFLVPVIEERKAASRKGEEMPDDVLQWMINKCDKYGSSDPRDLAMEQLELSQAAIHTTTMTATKVLYEIAAMPEIIKPLRDEIRRVTAEFDGVLTTNALYQLKLLDSVCKETTRVVSLSAAQFQRKVLKDITLKDGLRIPAGTHIEVSSAGVNSDAAIFPDPEKFDPWRFYNLRQAGEQHVNRHQMVTVTKDSLEFGYGKHACPGRFFAVNEIKLILANLLLRFDFKMKQEDAKQGKFKPLPMGLGLVPDPSKELLFKRVKS